MRNAVSFAQGASRLHGALDGLIMRVLSPSMLGLLGRVTFAAVLLVYYGHSAGTKVGEGLSGFFSIQPGAYFQIIPSVVEAYGYDPSAVPFLPYGLIVVLGTYAEFLLPLAVTFGLFTRLSALSMIGFILVQSAVDILFHGAGEGAIGALFDRMPDAAILDQRTLWVFLLLVLAGLGGGFLSLDRLLGLEGRRAT